MPKFLRIPIEVIAILIGIAGVVLVLYAWHLPPFRTSVESTENAYVKGYVTLISPQLSGYVSEVAVTDYAKVKAGDVLVRLDDRIYAEKLAQAKATLASQKALLANSTQQQLAAKASIDAAEAQLDSAEAAAKRSELAWERIASLVHKGISATSDYEQAQATLEQSRASVHQAQAAIETARQNLAVIVGNRSSLEAGVSGAEAAVQLAEIDLGNTVIIAPRDGRIGEVGVRLGQYVTAGSQLMAVVPADVWVIANFKETQLDGMKVGQPVTIAVDALGHRHLTGHIEGFSPAAGSEFAVIKPDNATGNFTKIAQRIGTRIRLDEGQDAAALLAPGLSVVVTVDKASSPDSKFTAH
ncbi:MAG: hemolysin secretion protein D [Rhizobium sp. 63-7]|nr:HlyD family secretion protein [Hyphomicrobiales bacterium]OJU00699.1 MAG: hemolysin secretion protein D [Rhizobium sp. 63-7]